ncbi:MAG: adenosine kinase [Victivallales bacterium]|nr:adenosine kinase [Victivallales bacterium]
MHYPEVKVLGCGSPIVDILVNVEDEFVKENVQGDKGGMELVDISVINNLLGKINKEKSIVPGGAAANTIMTLTKLGLKTGFLGKLGKDKQGEFYKESYIKAGGDEKCFKYSDVLNTATCLSIVTPDSERTMRTFLGAAATIVPEEISAEDFKGYTHLNIEGYMLHNRAVITKVLELAKRIPLKVALDLGSFEIVRDNMDILPELLKNYVDIVFCNDDESRQYSNSDDPEKIFDVLGDDCEVIALKLGKKGSVIKAGENKARIPAKIVDAVDTTGAGDVWQAGFLYKYITSKELSGKLLEKAGGFASMLSAEAVQVMGASIPERSWKYIKNRI